MSSLRAFSRNTFASIPRSEVELFQIVYKVSFDLASIVSDRLFDECFPQFIYRNLREKCALTMKVGVGRAESMILKYHFLELSIV